VRRFMPRPLTPMKPLLPLGILLITWLSPLHAAELRLASVFTDHMVLQRDKPVPVWGTADPGQEVQVHFAGQQKTTRTDASGRWMVKLAPLQANARPDILRVNGLAIEDVLVGDVWLCSGQSNMGFPVEACLHPQQEIAQAQYPGIRLFSVAQNPSLTPVHEVQGTWKVCSPETVGRFSGAAYFFGRELHQRVKVPIGLLLSSVGGTPAEAWTRREALATVPLFAARADKENAEILSQKDDNERFVTERAAWEAHYGVTPPPISEKAKNWADADLDETGWSRVTLPASWSGLGMKSGGVFWIRREFEVPAASAGKPFLLGLNWVTDQYDTAYFNGVEVGHASDKAPGFNHVQRSYPVPGKLVKAGRNVVAVRVVSATERASLYLPRTVGVPVEDRHAAQTDWLFRVEHSFAPLPPDALKSRPKPNNQALRNVSASLYNGMIAPLLPTAIRGAVWYQGESNSPRASEYGELLSLLIRDWRTQWGQGDFPFLIQQLVNNGLPHNDPNKPSSWPLLREAQARVAESLPQCGIAVGIELGDPHTIHPANKQDVGKRLALVALEKVYGEPVESSGPRFESMQKEGSAIRIRFSHAAGLHSKEGPLRQFAIAGEDQNYVWADAKLDGETVLVSHPQVPMPASVRYAWSDNPDGCNLFNGAGLPAMPFRTDTVPK
jgi:sialate O-acetylesterase